MSAIISPGDFKTSLFSIFRYLGILLDESD